MQKKLTVPKRIELLFDGIYLLSAAVMGFCLLSSSVAAQQLWGVMALTLAAGDAFHLLPRMAAAYTGDTSRFMSALGIGKLVTSLTMTVFYLLLWHIGLHLFSLTLPIQTTALYLLACTRFLLCLLPQNRWQDGQADGRMGLYRNLPFTAQGLLVLWLYASHAELVSSIRFLWLAILISFACYLPVVLWGSERPKLGMLMLPKTCAYLWIISMGFHL